MIRKLPAEVITTVLLLLFVYTAVSKMLDVETFSRQMLNQPLPRWFSTTLARSLPAIELITSFLLVYKPLRYYGLIISFLLLSAVTLYVALIISKAFNYIPCSCGGVLENMSWPEHLVFNGGFTLLAFTGILQEHMYRRQKHE